MIEAVTLGTVQADTPGQVAPVETAAAPVQQEQQQPETSWLSALDEDTRKFAEAQGFKAPADPIKRLKDQVAETTRLQQEALRVPKDDAPKEEWDKFYAKLGRPESPDGYQLKLPDGMPKDLPYDEAFAGKFKAWAHETGLPPRAAQALHDRYVSEQIEIAKAQQERHEQAVASATEALEKAWGKQGSETFNTNVALAQRVMQAKGPEFMAALSSGPAIDAKGRVINPAIAQLLAEHGALTQRDDAVISGSQAVRENSVLSTLYPKEGT